MKTSKSYSSPSKILPVLHPALASVTGNVLVYLVVVILIFGVLGVTIVSLFTSATTSSATPNDARRAYYIAESGVRYALSRIRNTNFYQDTIKAINNTPQYTLDDGSNFTINVFSPWFISPTDYLPGNNPFTLSVPNDGKIPQNFSIASGPEFRLVDLKTFRFDVPLDNYLPQSYAEITGSSITAGNTSLTITLEGSHGLTLDTDDIACLAVQPTDADASSPLQAGEDIYIAAEAKDFFPPRNGAIRIVSNGNGKIGEYYYEELVDESTRVKLTGLATLPGSSFIEIDNFGTDDWVVLSRHNYRVIATGKSGDVTTVIGDNKQVWFFSDVGEYTITEREFIQDADRQVTDESVIKTSLGATEDDDEIRLGEDIDPDPGFGTIWYGGDKPIGGDSNFCQSGSCLFGDGIRVFFTLDYSGDGEGFVFALINGADNTSNSAGGDVERSELLGYAGDSRENPSGAPFLDGSLNGDGLLPPKIGVEFDTRTNFNSEFEQTLRYCNGASLNPNTRNDPQPGGNPEDAVQHIFWGREVISSFPLIACRDDDATYDDNKHDAEDIFEKWQFNTGDNVRSSPAVGADGTVYVGSDSDRVYALNPADRQRDFEVGDRPFPSANEWEFVTGGQVRSSPAIGADGTVYIGSNDNKVYALNPTERLAGSAFPSTNEWEFTTGADVQSSPAIGSGGTIYIGDDAGTFFALSPAGVKRWEFTDPGLRITSRGRPAIGPALDIDPTGVRQRIYITSRENGDRTLYALDPDDRQNGELFPNAPSEWIFDLGDEAEFMPGVDDRPLPLGIGTVYSDEFGAEMRAVGPDSSLGVGNSQWVTNVGTDIDSTPAVGADGTIYFGGDSGHVFALEPANGLIDWRFPDVAAIGAVRTSPALGPDGTIYFGSDDNRLYALNPDVSSENDRQKFNFNTGDLVRSSPAVDPRDESVYVGSDSNRLHAFNQLAEPRNFRDDSVEDNKLVSSADFPAITFADSNNWLQGPDDGGTLDGTWAVRIEVTRETVTVDAEDKGLYTLKTWVEKCTEAGCSQFLSSLFRNTLINYKVSGRPPKLEQTLILSEADHTKFVNFLFGFTSAAASGDTQEAIIRFFELSFIRRFEDPDIFSDPNLDG